MIELAVGLLVIALIAGALGFTNIAKGAAGVAKVIFFVVIAGAVILLILVALGVSLIT